MTEQLVAHATFSLERSYPVEPRRVFAAWADPAAKARWFGVPDGEHELDFRVGGREVTSARREGKAMRFETVYRDIVADRRIVYSSGLFSDGRLATVSLTTVEFDATGQGALLRLTEQATYLDGMEQPSWREEGTSAWLDALERELNLPPIRVAAVLDDTATIES